MRTTEAARYARWSVTVAAMLALVVAGVYIARAWQVKQAEGTAPPPVPPAVQQRSAAFTFSKVEGPRTQFIVRASHATEFKEGGRTLLEDVWITTFGGNGQRSDQLRTSVCEYFALSGKITCPEEVKIDLQGNRPTGAAATPAQDAQHAQDSPLEPAANAVHIVTSHLSFDRNSGVAVSDQPVQFRFAQGEGHAVGLSYDSQRGELHLLHEVELVFRSPAAADTVATELPSNDPMIISSDELLFRRQERLIHLSGAATMQRGRQELQAGQMTLELDDDMRAKRLVARDQPVLHDPSGSANVSLSADELVAPLTPGGQPVQVIGTGHVVLNALRAEGRNQLTAASATLDLDAGTQQPRHVSAAGDVVVQASLLDGSTRRLQTSQLEVDFVAVSNEDSRIEHVTAVPGVIEWQNPARTASRQDAESMRLAGQHLDGSFGESGELRELRGSGGVEVQRHMAGGAPMTSTSRELLALIAPDGAWTSIDQTGAVRLKNATGDAQGDRAHFERAADTVTMTGSVILTDASSQTRAKSATFRQTASELRADGGVSTSELPPSDGGSTAGVSEPSHITSDHMVADTANGHAVYSGKARLWQGDSVIQADTIDLDRAMSILIATGNVNAIFPQTHQAQSSNTAVPGAATLKGAAAPPPPQFWRAEAGRMVYEGNQHRARLEENARARSADGTMRANRMDLFFAPPTGATGSSPGASSSRGSPKPPTGLGASLGSQQLQRVQGFGAVRVDSADRTGTGEKADYTAAEGKFVLSGGKPKIIDKFGNSTAGRQLTFFFSNDRIDVDSEEGSRTLTLHRVEK